MISVNHHGWHPVGRRFGALIGVVALCLVALSCGPARGDDANDDQSISSTVIPETYDVNIGVLAFRGSKRAVRRWTPTADYLSAVVPGYAFKIMPLALDEMERAANDGSIDFVLTNSGNYVMLESGHRVSRIATLRTPSNVDVGNVFGAVIFTQAGHPAIKTLKDLKDRSFIAVNRNGFGGFQMAWRELKAHDIDPFDDFSSLTFAGFPQDAVVDAVLKGKVDAGTIRTGTLENMADEGKISLSDFRILSPRSYRGFPYELSTQLYPEWPFARLPTTSDELSQKVAIALLSMPEDHPAAKAGRYAGWSVPSDYKPVYDMFHDLRIGPFSELGKVTLRDVLRKHWHWFVFALVLVLILAGWATHTEAVVKDRTRDLRKANEELEKQISERRKAEKEARHRQNEIAHVCRFSTMGEMATNLAHELNQPLSAIANYAQGSIRRLSADQTDPEPLLDAMHNVAEQTTRAGEIIHRIRTFLRKDEPVRVPLDLSEVMRDVVRLLSFDIAAHETRVETDFTPDLAMIDADQVQLQQVLLNLMRNGMEAMAGVPVSHRTLSVATRAKEGGWITLTVADRGPGIPTENLNHIFNAFYTTKASGLGMGLSISRSIVESHGGSLAAEPRPGGGMVFEITLPASQANAKPHDETAEEKDEDTTHAA